MKRLLSVRLLQVLYGRMGWLSDGVRGEPWRIVSATREVRDSQSDNAVLLPYEDSSW